MKVLENARRQELVDALADLRRAKPGDILVVYLAGHGVVRDDVFYYLTADAASFDLSDPEVRRSTAISSVELIEEIKRIPALKQVLILDTCASGSLVAALAGGRGPPTRPDLALDRMKDRTGMFVLAGCAADRVSYEATKFGQGLLTYSLLQGMKGAQLREREYVDVVPLFGYAIDRVPALAREIGGAQQPLLATPGGQSFDIGRMTDQEKAAVPLQAVRPSFGRPSLQDAGEGADVLGLEEQITSLLRDEAADPSGVAVAFVDSSAPDVFRISGTYATKDGRTTARFRLRRDKEATSWIVVEGSSGEVARRIVLEAKKESRTLFPGRER